MIISLANDPTSSFQVDEKNYLTFAYRGSVAHNMAIFSEDSIDDVDFIGVCFGSPRCYLGNEEFGSRGTYEYKRGRLDIVVYELRKAVSLMLNGNPNILSLLWNRSSMYKFQSKDFIDLLKIRHIFSSKQVGNSFSGYAWAQLQKMETRDPAELRLYLAVTNEMKFRGIHPNNVGAPFVFNRVSGEDKDVANWDSEALKRSLAGFRRKGENLGYMGDKRKQLVLQNGYDTKNAAHCIRLLRMGVEFLKTHELTVWRQDDVAELLDIKKGKWTLEEVKKLADDLFAQLKEAQATTTLPDEPDRETAWGWCENALRKHLSLT